MHSVNIHGHTSRNFNTNRCFTLLFVNSSRRVSQFIFHTLYDIVGKWHAERQVHTGMIHCADINGFHNLKTMIGLRKSAWMNGLVVIQPCTEILGI